MVSCPGVLLLLTVVLNLTATAHGHSIGEFQAVAKVVSEVTINLRGSVSKRSITVRCDYVLYSVLKPNCHW